MDEFTSQERKQIDEIYKREFENMTADEVQLLMRWNTAKAQRDAAFKAEQERLQAESEARIADEREKAQIAKDRLETLRDAAKLKLELIKNGQA